MEISFNYIATFISLIYGLALAHALTCIAEYVQNIHKIKNYWVWWVWALFLLLLSNGFWISIYHIWSQVEQWEMIYVVFISFEACLFYLMYYFFFNHLKDLEENNLRIDYYKNSRYFFTLLTIALLCMLNLSEVLIGKFSLMESFSTKLPGVAICSMILVFTKNHKLHAFLSIVMTLMFSLIIIFEFIK